MAATCDAPIKTFEFVVSTTRTLLPTTFSTSNTVVLLLIGVIFAPLVPKLKQELAPSPEIIEREVLSKPTFVD